MGKMHSFSIEGTYAPLASELLRSDVITEGIRKYGSSEVNNSPGDLFVQVTILQKSI